MLNSRYIEVTSSRRDRTRYPHPAQFVTELSLSGQENTSGGSKDPVYNSVTKYPPPNLEFPTTYDTTGYMYGPLINGGNVPSDYIIGILPILKNVNNQISVEYPLGDIFENGYIGDMLELVSQTVSGVETALNEYRRILDYKVVPSTDSFGYITTTIDAVEPILTTSVPLVSTIACDIDNFFTGWTIQFTTTTVADLEGVERIVAYYRGYDRRIFFNEPILTATITAGDAVILKVPTYELRIISPFSIESLPALTGSCSLDDNVAFRIRSGLDIPINEGTLVSGSTTTFELPSGTIDYTGDVIWITTDPIVFSGALTSATFVASGGNQVQGTFVLPVGASVYADDFFNNMTITLTSGNFNGQSYLITDWDNGTLTGTVTPGWTSLVVGTTAPAVADTFEIIQPNPSQYRRISAYNTTTRVGTINQPFSYTTMQGTTVKYAVGSADTFEILQFKHDNYSALNYPGSPVGHQNATCYEIELISLTVPNIPLKTGIGGTIEMYPFVYVEFSSVMQGTSAYDFASNNPVVGKHIMFRVPVMWNYTTRESAFLTLDSHGQKNTIKFSTNDAFRFSVYLPNGELFITEQDYFSPSEPNPLLQISAMFSISRLVSECCDTKR